MTVPQLIQRVKVRGRLHAERHAGQIVSIVSRRYGVPVQAIRGRNTTQRVAGARHIAIWLMRELLGLPYREISSSLGLLDHTTALHAWRLVEAKREVDPDYAADLSEIKTIAADELKVSP